MKESDIEDINGRKVAHRVPAEESLPEITEQQSNSVGMPALMSSLKHMRQYMDMPKAVRASLKMNQKGGFDCPGCAWPDPDDERSSIAEYCENGIKALAEEASKKLVTADFFAQYSIEELSHWSDFQLGKSGRLAQPMYLPKDKKHYEPISWDMAFDKIAGHLNALPSPDEALFYTSGRTSNEAAFLYQLFARAYGTNNLPDCSNMCHESSGVGLSRTVGIGKGSVKLSDIHEAELIIVMGQNPGTNHPRMLSALEKCKENGGKIVTVNPIKEAGLIRFKNPQRPFKMIGRGTELTDLYLQVAINGDVAFLKALMLLLLEKEESGTKIFDRKFIEDKTEGYDAFIEDLRRYDLQDCLDACGLGEAEVRQVADWLEIKNKVIVCWAMGLTQHENGVDNITEIVNLLLLKGAIGKPGAGTCPVRGHSNVQGDRTMGIWEAPKDAFLDKLQSVFGFDPPRHHGYATVPAIKAMHEGKAKVFIGMGGNFLSATPDTDYTARALQNCSLTVQVSTKLNRSHLVCGEEALILPCIGRTEVDVQAGGYQFISVENSMGNVHSSKGIFTPVSEHLKSEPAIIGGMAKATLGDKVNIDWDSMVADYDLIRNKIEAVIPGFESYNDRVRQDGGFYLPNCAREGKFNTPSGKAQFTVNAMPKHELKDNEFHLMTVRSHDQFNTTIYGPDDRYRGVYNGRRIIMMHKDAMNDLGLQPKEKINVHSHFKGEVRSIYNFAVVPYDIPKKCLSAYFPEANPLVPVDAFAKGSLTPVSKLIKVTIEKAG